MAEWRCKADRNLPVVHRGSWDGPAAEGRMFDWAGWPDDPDGQKACRGFLAVDVEAPELKGSYKLPFADIEDGKLVAVDAGLAAAAQRLPQTDIPEDVKEAAQRVIDRYRRKAEGKSDGGGSSSGSGSGDDGGGGDGGGGGGGGGQPPPGIEPPGVPPPGHEPPRIGPPPDQPPPGDEPPPDQPPGWGDLPGVRVFFEVGDGASMRLSSRLQVEAVRGRRRQYSARLVRAGRIRYADGSPGPFVLSAGVLQGAVERGLFAGVPAFVDHAGFFESSSLRDLAGVVTSAEWNPVDQSVDGVIRLYDTEPGRIVGELFDQVLADEAAGEPSPDLGLSLVFWPEWDEAEPPAGMGEPLLMLAGIRSVESCDFVFQPAADGRVKAALSALALARVGRPVAPRFGFERRRGVPASEADDLPILNEGVLPPIETERPSVDGGRVSMEGEAWVRALRETAVEAMIGASGLPAAAREMLRRREYRTPAEVEAAIEAERGYLAALRQDQVVQVGDQPPRGGLVQGMRTSLDQIEAALYALMEGVAPPSGVRPLTGIRELYHLLSGDYEMSGVFQPDRVYLANVNSSTMAGLVANALNKVVVNQFQTYPRWWEPIVTEVDFANLQDARWITLGGVGELPTVPEGGAYTELTWDDQTETSAFVKKGGYLGITLETIDKDDTGRVRAAPRALAQAAWLTLSKSIAGIFTSNPTMSDGNALFHGSHGNLGSSALSWTSFKATQTAMMKQTELNSGERLGAMTRPYYLLVPVDLEITALQILATEHEPGSANYNENPFAQGNEHDERMRIARKRVVVVPMWTDATDWVAMADPVLYPSIGLGYRYGRTPTVQSVASPTAGLMFTNDTLPVKVRFFYATGPVDWRGVYKHVVVG